MSVTLSEHIVRGAKVLEVLRKHGADIQDLEDDLPKAIEIGADLHEVFKEEAVQKSTATAEATSPHAPAPATTSAPKITAKQAAQHVEQHGLSEADRAILKREQLQTG